MNVFSFVATTPQQNFSGDLMDFVRYLVSKQGVPASQVLQSVGAGTEPFSGVGARLVVSKYSLGQK